MKRVEYVDTAKGYLMLLVVIGHVLIVLNPEYNKLYYTAPQAFIYTFHMPAFFIIHGILFDVEKWQERSTKEFFVRRFQTLMIPYCFFELIGMLWRIAFFGQSLWTGLYNLVTVRCNVGADWFLPAMFLGGLLFMVYVRHPSRIYGVVSAALCFLLPMGMSGHQVLIVIGRGLLAYAFIMSGHLLRSLFLSEKTKSSLWIALSFAVTAGVAVYGLKFGGNDFYPCLVQNPVTFFIGGVSGTVLIIGLSRILHCKMITDYIGNHTLLIMGTHQLAIYAMTALVPGLYGGTIMHGLLLAVAILAFEIPVVWILDTKIDILTGKGFSRNKGS